MIINKYFTVLIVLLLTFSLKSQSMVSWLTEELPSDSISHFDMNYHATFSPKVTTNTTLKHGFDLGKNTQLIPVVDLGTQISSSFPFRVGGGAIFEGQPFTKFYFRAGISGIYDKGDSLFKSNYNAQISGTNFALQPMARLSYSPNHFFNFQAGIDKTFIGEGTRSLLLSDYGKSYPFAQIKTHFWHIEYTILYQLMRENYLGTNRTKFMSSHHISYNINKWFNVGVFETVIFQPKDTLLKRGFDAEYLNPMVFYRPQEYAIGSSDNVLMGLSLTFKQKKFLIYSQIVLDDLLISQIKSKSGWWANKFGGQIGIKGKLKIKKEVLFSRFEVNVVRPFTYSHLNVMANYGNKGEVLAHPMHSNFIEFLGELKWQKSKWFAKTFFSFGMNAFDFDGFSYGNNVYMSYTLKPYGYGFQIGEGRKNYFGRLNLHAAYNLTEKGNINAFAELQFRYDSALEKHKFNFLPAIGIRSYLWNDYRNY